MLDALADVQQLYRNTVFPYYSYTEPMSQRFHGYAGVQGRGVLTLPAELRRRLRLDDPGAQVELTERDDGVVEMRATVAIPADQAWFWTKRWQRMEREADADIAAGRVATFDDTESFLADLDR
jgi:bifunctional DNA-binding transcriptional regulator/antitoxin component of YhaV-PrlF toxin-antitoxin module